jgi:hypothetical protein
MSLLCQILAYNAIYLYGYTYGHIHAQRPAQPGVPEARSAAVRKAEPERPSGPRSGVATGYAIISFNPSIA